MREGEVPMRLIAKILASMCLLLAVTAAAVVGLDKADLKAQATAIIVAAIDELFDDNEFRAALARVETRVNG